MTYASFWQRFWAAIIDAFILLAVTLPVFWVESFSRILALVLVVPMSALYLGYNVYCHGRFGQTIGKREERIKVVKLNGDRIGWREAWLRNSVDIGFAVLRSIAYFGALLSIPDAAYDAGWMERTKNIEALMPSWWRAADVLNTVWVWSEVVVMLLNRKRRALHDFIAGTVVIALPKTSDAKVPAA